MSEGEDSAAVVDPNPRSPHQWSPRRKKKKRKRKASLFTKKKVRTTTSNLRIPKQQRRKLYRDRCKQKKLLIARGVIDGGGRMPPINHEHLEANYPAMIDENDDENREEHTNQERTHTNTEQNRQSQPINTTRYPLRSRTANTLASTPIKQERISRKRARNHNVADNPETVSNLKVEGSAIKAEPNGDIKTESKHPNDAMKSEVIIDTSTLPTLGHFAIGNEQARVKEDDALYEPAQKRVKVDAAYVEPNNFSTLGVINSNNNQTTNHNNHNNNNNENIDLNQLFMMGLTQNPINMNLNTREPIHYVNNSNVNNTIGYSQHQNVNHVAAYGYAQNNNNDNILNDIQVLNSSMNLYHQFQNDNVNNSGTNALQMLASVAFAMQDQSNNNNNTA